MQDPKDVIDTAVRICRESADLGQLESNRLSYFGKQGLITLALKELRNVPVADKARYAAVINETKATVEALFKERRGTILLLQINDRIASQEIDVTLPGRGRGTGGLHPLSRSLQRIQTIFSSLGFEVADGPEIETSHNNFTALNMPENHPARSMHDTFYIEGDDIQLRTHTSPIQARYMKYHSERHKHLAIMPEIRIIAPGRTYRVDSDATHSPMFHQLEGLWVGKDISFANLKWIVQEFLRVFFEMDKLEIRFRPSFFPFTEPSAEVDVAFFSGSLKGKWLEVGGCGMVHPNVLIAANINPEKYIGFAFGMGIDRLTMLRYGVDDLRTIYENDLRFLEQFN